MPVKSHSSAPKFDDDPANLESYFTELEHLFNRCRIRYDADKKVEAVCYLDATQREVWRGTEEYEDETTAWDDFKQAIYRLYPGSGQEQRINLTDIVAFAEASAKAPYPNKKELGAYYRQLLSKTNALIHTN